MISVVILSKNEEKNIKACIESVLWCDEIIVVDDHSDDDTAKVAKSSGALVYYHDLKKDFAAQRNFGLSKAHGEWVLFLDADERVSETLQNEIQQVLDTRRNRYAGYLMKRDDYIMGKRLQHGETANSRFLRLAKKDAGSWTGKVHEVWDISGHIGEFQNPIEHYPHESIASFLRDVNFYTTLRAQELYEQNIHANWVSILLHTKGKFFQNYVLKGGVLDGIPGIISALMMSFHAFLVRSKLWLQWQNKHQNA